VPSWLIPRLEAGPACAVCVPGWSGHNFDGNILIGADVDALIGRRQLLDGRATVHIVIMGCGRVGATLAHILEDQGHSVAIIDQESESFRRLGSGFKGRRITGVGFDRDILIEAGIEEAAAFAAVSSGDNSNIIAARVARETFGVQNVGARIYDPRRAEVYQRLGIPTVATVRWTAHQMLRRLLPEGAEPLWRDPSGKMVLADVGFASSWIGEKASALEDAAHTRIAFISRLGEAMTCPPGTVLQEGDVVHVIAPEADLDRITAVFAESGGGER
jgi:trk system potassium uptake protein TrkA